jgi:hypothetical protein
MTHLDTLVILAAAMIIFMGLLVWAIMGARKEVLKDWDTLEYLKTKANEVSTKEEIEEFHKEFVEKASKIHNQYINIELHKIDGYLKGQYKQLTK